MATGDAKAERKAALEARKRRLKRAFEVRGLRQVAVAAASGIDVTTFSNMVTGKIVTIEEVDQRAIARALRVPPGPLFFGPDEALEAALSEGDPAHDPELHSDEIPIERRAPTGTVASYRLSPLVEDGLIQGPAAWKHRPARLRKRIEKEHYMRAEREKAPPRMRDLTGVPPGGDVIEVRTPRPIQIREGNEVIDTLNPGDLLIIDVDLEKTPPVPESEEAPGRLKRSLVIAQLEDDPDELDETDPESGLSRTKLFRFRPNPDATVLFPLNGDRKKYETVEKGWRIVGVVVERR